MKTRRAPVRRFLELQTVSDQTKNLALPDIFPSQAQAGRLLSRRDCSIRHRQPPAYFGDGLITLAADDNHIVLFWARGRTRGKWGHNTDIHRRPRCSLRGTPYRLPNGV